MEDSGRGEETGNGLVLLVQVVVIASLFVSFLYLRNSFTLFCWCSSSVTPVMLGLACFSGVCLVLISIALRSFIDILVNVSLE